MHRLHFTAHWFLALVALAVVGCDAEWDADVRPGRYIATVTNVRPHPAWRNSEASRATAPEIVDWCRLPQPVTVPVEIRRRKGTGTEDDAWPDYSITFEHPISHHRVTFCGFKQCEGNGVTFPGPKHCAPQEIGFSYCDRTVDDHLATAGDLSPHGTLFEAPGGLRGDAYDAFWDGVDDPSPVTAASILCPNSTWQLAFKYE